MAAENLEQEGVCKHFRGTCFLFNAEPYEYSRLDLDTICHDVHSKGISNDSTVWEMYSSSSGLSCFTVLLPYKARKSLVSSQSTREERYTSSSTSVVMSSEQWPSRSGKTDTRSSSGMWSESFSSIPSHSEFHSKERCSTLASGKREYMNDVMVQQPSPHHRTAKYDTVIADDSNNYERAKDSKVHSQYESLQQYPPHWQSPMIGYKSKDRTTDRLHMSVQTCSSSASDPFPPTDLLHSIFTYPPTSTATTSNSPVSTMKKWKIITLGLKLDKVGYKVCPCYKVYSVNPEQWLPAGMVKGKHKGRTSSITVREVIGEYLRELEKFGKYKKIGRNCSDFAAMFINLMSCDNGNSRQRKKVSGVEVMCEACHRWICKCCC